MLYPLSRIKLKQPDEMPDKIVSEKKQEIFEYEKAKNVSKDGNDFLMSSLPLGEFGSEIVTTLIGEGPKTFNPWESRDNTSSQMSGLMFDSLVSTDVVTGEIIPKLAKKIEISKDKKKYKIFLRKGVKWTNGEELDADDVVFTWNEIIFKGLGNTSTRDSLYINNELPKIKKIDSHTVEFETPEPFAPFLRMLETPIANKKQMQELLKKNKGNFTLIFSSNVNPEEIVSSGPFILQEYKPAQRVVFKRNPNYYFVNSKFQRLPYIDKYIFQIVADQNTEILKFESKESDVLNLTGDNVAKFVENKKNSDYKIYNLGPTSSTLFIAFNLNDRKDKNGKFYVEEKKQKWFQDKNFRTAIDYAIDREAIIQNVASGVGAPLFTPESLNSIYLNKKIAKGHLQNTEKSLEYLKKSGFYLDKNNILHDKYDNIVEFELLTNAGNLEREIIGVMIKQDLAEIGIKVNFKPIEFNTLVNRITNTLNFETIVLGLTGSTLEPHGGKNVWASNGALHFFNKRNQNENNKNILNFEKELDSIFEKGALCLDFNERKKFYDRYQEIIYDEKPIIYLYSPLNIVAVRNDIRNLHPTPLGGIFHNIEEIWRKK